MELHDLLHGSTAFYKQADYVENAEKEFRASAAPPPILVIETGNKTWRIAKQVLFTLGCALFVYAAFSAFQNLGLPQASFPMQAVLFPFTFPKLIHQLGSIGTVPAWWLHYFSSDEMRASIDVKAYSEQGTKLKRFSIEIDGYTIDAVMIGREDRLKNGRWSLLSQGNGELYEYLCYPEYHHDLMSFLDTLDSNAILFNYPGVGASSGLPDRDIMVKAYEALLKILEEDVQAKTIFGYGHSIGGGVQAEALKEHAFKKDVRYLFMKSRTFADFADTAADVLSKPIDAIVRWIHWNFETAKNSKNLEPPELIFQTSNGHFFQDLSDHIEKIIFDGVIDAPVSLAHVLLSDKKEWNHKFFMGIPENHNQGFPKYFPAIAEKVEEMLSDFYSMRV